MFSKRPADLSKFFIAGINYKKTDAETRGKYAITKDKYYNLLLLAQQHSVNEFFVLSTCNRTEIYGFAKDALTLCHLLCTQTEGSIDDFCDMAYIKNGTDALEHLLNVSAGLDSQIIGDYEIVSQLKTAVKFSREHGFINVMTERLVNTALRTSKKIKTDTELSGGTVSVSFAAVQHIRELIPDINVKKILVLGTGKIGRNTCKNLVDYLGAKNITLINRSESKAKNLAEILGVQSARIEELPQHIASADIILTATNSPEPVIFKSHLGYNDKKLIIDLSVPYNVEPVVQQLPGVTLLNVDTLSKMKDDTLAMRLAEVPKAKDIIAEHIIEFMDWYQMRKNVLALKAVKIKLKEIHTSPPFIHLYNHSTSLVTTEEKIQRVINGMASKMKTQNKKGCLYIEAINEFITTGTN
ncbi:MAG TPA: glutamyl-tRNA reductase [Chitinophagaceae bacterium]|nr:glutamyl-tRNA reductase [Chitinophagaceae bacterium]